VHTGGSGGSSTDAVGTGDTSIVKSTLVLRRDVLGEHGTTRSAAAVFRGQEKLPLAIRRQAYAAIGRGESSSRGPRCKAVA
jgi:hypothetical protein